jgi:hypothetical protein
VSALLQGLYRYVYATARWARFVGIPADSTASSGKSRSGKKFGTALPSTELMFLMGTIHRFPDQWLIVSVFYPPKQQQLLDLE